MKPNPKQQEAILQTEGPLLIIAGAGSGKTATLTKRVEYMISEKNINPSSIMMVTFTNKAASEMRERVAKTLGVEMPRNIYSKRNFPLIGTFHSIGIFILKEVLDSKKYQVSSIKNSKNLPLLGGNLEGAVVDFSGSISEHIGLKKDFVIYDESDKISVLKSIIKTKLGLDEKEFPARKIAFYISNAKNNLIDAKKYETEVDSQIKEVVFKTFVEYEKELKSNNALDFDDILTKTFEILKFPKILNYYQEKYKYLMVDEYQDTNKPQYEIIKLLANKYRNLAVVGDDAQCLVGDTKVFLENNINEKIKNLKIGQKILSYDGSAKQKYYEITDIYKNKVSENIYTIKTKKGYEINTTSKHIFFVNPEHIFPNSQEFGVYLMYKHKVGYRIGFTRFKGISEKNNNIYGLRKRLNGEQADKAWLIFTTNSKKEAKYFEQYYSFKYAIPQTVFTAKGKLTELDQQDIENIYKNIDTEKNAKKLLFDLQINEKYPHIIASASNRFKKLRVNINFLMMGGNEKNRRFGIYRVTLHTSHKKIINLLEKNFTELCRKSKLGIRIDKELANPEKILQIVNELYEVLTKNNINTEIIERLSFINGSYLFMPASNLQKGFSIAIFDGKKWNFDEIIDISKEKKETYVYDLNISRTHNFVANNFLVHNSIYSWRGADMTNIINFKKDYSEALIVKLEQNYRSTKNIISGANSVIKNNNFGIKKELWTENIEGEIINYIEAPDDKSEANIIASIIANSVIPANAGINKKENSLNDSVSSTEGQISSLEEGNSNSSILPPKRGELEGGNYSDNLILYRTNAQSRQIEESLMMKNIPYKVIGGLKFYDRKEIKDLIAYLKVIFNNNDVVSMKRIINTPTRKIGAKSIEILDNYRNNFGLSYPQIIENIEEVEELNSGAKKAISNFYDILKYLINFSKEKLVFELIREIVKITNYEEYLTKDLSQEEKEAKLQNIDELVNLATEYNGLDPKESLEMFLEEISLLTDMDLKDERADFVTLMTIHTSKGLEEKRVFLTGVEEGIFPSFRSLSENAALEEERRLMYVAMTRAKEELFISRAKERFYYGDYVRNPESRFLKEIDSNFIQDYNLSEYLKSSGNNFFDSLSKPSFDFKETSNPNIKLVRKTANNDISQFNVGDKVAHHKFGNGIITELVGEIASIAFSGKGIKKMNIKIAPVRKI